MDEIKRERLQACGWSVGTAEKFLELSPAESELVKLKLALTHYFSLWHNEIDTRIFYLKILNRLK